jgi:DNA replication and repair protein RecF
VVYLKRIELKNFRCFIPLILDVDSKVVLLEGNNGSGKTTIIEALHYVCYLKSFRTSSIKDLIGFGSEGFFIKIVCDEHEITVGSSGKKRHIAIDRKRIESYQELRDFYQIVTLTEHDLAVVQDSPDARRSFIDHTLLLFYPSLLELFKNFKTTLENRNTLLFSGRYDQLELELWTERLFDITVCIQKERNVLLEKLSSIIINNLQSHIQRDCLLSFTYQAKKIEKYQERTFQEFLPYWKNEIFPEEQRFKRSCFGAHLDDIQILFNTKPARMFSSRGQQKLIVVLLKMAQVVFLHKEGRSTTFLLDDFLTDFDPFIMKQLLELCKKLNAQLIFTAPSYNNEIFIEIFGKDIKIITL